MLPKKRQRVNFNKNSHEYAAWAQNSLVCGIDEVGRGCLAGPLVTAAVIIAPHKESRLIKDSKVLTEEERLHAFKWIHRNAWYGYGIVHHRLIDSRNIWHATLLAMKRAVVNVLALCPIKPSSILVDAMPLKLSDTSFKDIPVHHFPKGETLSISIAAASIVAKVKRDAMMAQFDPLFPGYELGKHKGYSTPDHKQHVRELQSSLIHRTTFLSSILTPLAPEDLNEEQQSLC